MFSSHLLPPPTFIQLAASFPHPFRTFACHLKHLEIDVCALHSDREAVSPILVPEFLSHRKPLSCRHDMGLTTRQPS